MMRIAHIVNPVKVDADSDLYRAQPVTFASLFASARQALPGIRVKVFSTQFEEDHSVIPDWIEKTDNLTRWCHPPDTRAAKRKLPFISDILRRLYEATEMEYCIYSNVDIAVLPEFYTFAAEIFSSGIDAFIVNRRTIPADLSHDEALSFMRSRKGTKHPGYDCFAFKRSILPRFILGEACIGANWIGRILAANLIAHANRFRLFENRHLTFHLGDCQAWKKPVYYGYDRHNERELHRTLALLKKAGLEKEKPLLGSFRKLIIKKNKMRRCFASGGLSQDPVFIVGPPRSGTTLLQALLASCDNTGTFPETHFFNYLYKFLGSDSGQPVREDDLNVFFQEAERLAAIRFRWYEQEYLRVLAYRGDLSAKSIFEIIVKRFLLRQMPLNRLSTVRWIEKTPNHALAMDRIRKNYPAATFLGLLRNPYVSVVSTRIHLKKDKPVDFLARKWGDAIDAMAAFKKMHPASLMVLTYEQLVAAPAETMKGVCRFLKIPYDENCLRLFGKTYRQACHPFEKWKDKVGTGRILETCNADTLRNLPIGQAIRIHQVTGRWARQYGYSLRASIATGLRERLFSRRRSAGNAMPAQSKGPAAATRFVILTVPRTGSNCMVESLNAHDQILCHYELFHNRGIYTGYVDKGLERGELAGWCIDERDHHPGAFLEAVWDARPFEAVGFKLFFQPEQHAAASRLVMEDPSVRVILLKRRNLLKMYVSLMIAFETGLWSTEMQNPSGRPPQKCVAVDVAEFKAWSREIIRSYALVLERLQSTGREHVTVYYEDWVANGKGKEAICEFLGLENLFSADPPGNPRFQKQNPDDLRLLIRNYSEVRDRLHGADHRWFDEEQEETGASG